MWRFLLPSSVLCALVLVGCPGNPPPATYCIADWQVRCDTVMGGCTPSPARQVTGINGQDGNSVDCTAAESATSRTINFTAAGVSGADRFSVRLSNATFPRGGGAAAVGCLVRVEEGGNTYQAACGGLDPTPTQPCQVLAAFSTDSMTGSPLAEITIICDHLPLSGAPTILRSVWASAGSTSPASFLFYDCRGLSGS